MRRTARLMSLALVLIVIAGASYLTVLAQDSGSSDTASHAIVGTWIVDTDVALSTDPPEVGLFLADGTMIGQGANRVAAGAWEVIDDRSVLLTLVTVVDQAEASGYAVVRGTHVLDETGNNWTCDDCSFTVVSASGEVLDWGTAPASATRMPVQAPKEVGEPLMEVPTWIPDHSD